MSAQLVGVTLALPQAAAHARDYAGTFGWEAEAPGRVSADLAAAWNAPALEGAALFRLRTGGAWIRIVDQDAAVPPPYATLGWSGAEVLVDDVDAVVAGLPAPRFRALAEPSALSVNADIRFCPVVGPAGELWLLTTVRNRAFGVESATRKVERPFLVTGGVHDLDGEQGRWSELGLRAQRLAVAMPGVSAVHALPRDHAHALALAALESASFLEAARYPDGATARPRPAGGLPPGLAFVTLAGPGWPRRMSDPAASLPIETAPQ